MKAGWGWARGQVIPGFLGLLGLVLFTPGRWEPRRAVGRGGVGPRTPWDISGSTHLGSISPILSPSLFFLACSLGPCVAQMSPGVFFALCRSVASALKGLLCVPDIPGLPSSLCLRVLKGLAHI